MASMMKIAAFLLLGMVLVASAADVTQAEARPSINADQVIPGSGRFDPAAMMMHQRRLQTLWNWRRPIYYPQPFYGFGGFPGGAASASATAASTPFGSSASAASSAGGFAPGYNGYYGGFGPFGFGRF